ncbi:MAG TPA: double zinc ribbon domain-containing protein [Candidatus Binatia bacterium]|nr:double zinc ribbon domain-containing protein [Candidatus Binatia bacterium]
MSRWLRVLLDAVFPPACEVCDAGLPAGAAVALCAACRAGMPPPPPVQCTVCGVPGAFPAGACPPCRARPPAFRRARAAALYVPDARGANAVAIAVQRLKYGGRRRLAAPLGALLAARYPFARDVLVVPVPLHPHRLRVRGFNQAALLARALARRRALPVAASALVRTRATAAQPGLCAAARRSNLHAAFRVARPGLVRGRSILLVDDVLTTGATADACAVALRMAGAACVDVYTLGRAP